MMYALLLLAAAAAAAAAVMVCVYDSCHVTSVKRGDLEGVGGRQQKLDAFYCIFELFRPLLAASLGRLAYERCRFCVRQRQDTLDHTQSFVNLKCEFDIGPQNIGKSTSKMLSNKLS